MFINRSSVVNLLLQFLLLKIINVVVALKTNIMSDNMKYFHYFKYSSLLFLLLKCYVSMYNVTLFVY